MNRRLVASVSVLALIGSAGMLVAGPLNPPAGPVTSTGKTITEVEPRIAINATNTPGDADSVFKITQPGSYYLAGNVSGVSGKHGIEIAASGVTIDLNGFSVRGVAGSLDGVIAAVGSLVDLTVRDGTLIGWGGDGLDLASANAANCRVEGLLASDNTGRGLNLGANTTVGRCSTYRNTGAGISTAQGCVIEACTSYSNQDFGILAASGCTVAGCVVRLNSTAGIACTSECVIRDNTCSGNGVFQTSGAGIRVTGSDNRIENNSCTTGDIGINVTGNSNIIIRNTSASNRINWAFAPNNIYGPVIDRTIVSTPGVGHDGAPSTLATTDPNANISY